MAIRILTAIFTLLMSTALWAVEKEAATAGLSKSPISKNTLVETLGGLVIVVLLIMALGWGFKKFAALPLSGKGSISIMGGVSLGPRERAVLLKVGETQLLVGVAPGRVQTLHVLTEPLSIDEASSDEGSFKNRLKQVMGQGAEEK